MSGIEINSQFEQVLKFVNQTSQPIFLTGKAGTGKTTLLKYIREKTFKQMAVVAPTGVAAINAGGSTIHSFFQFPFSPFLPILKDNGDVDITKSNLPTLKYNSQRLNIFRRLELLVIDEISMVRADLLDQIDLTLKFTRKKSHLPFGGVQVLLIGDMYQLPPVVQSEEWRLLSAVYKSPYFFESVIVRQSPPVYIELEKIYRQSEEKFIKLLNKVRNNLMDDESIALLNSHYKSNLTDKDYQNNITLTTHNRKADEINSRNLKALPGKEYKYKAKVEGLFNDKNYPADEVLVLKVGTRVMFLKNNNEKNYYNGKIGIVTYLDQEKIKVKCDEDKSEIEVAKETWTNVSYKIDKSTKHIQEEVLGTFLHFPLRLAWAITIHKSQGLTFDKLIIDAAESFSAGQVYVALSRCRSLAGLTLSSKIAANTLTNDQNILNFSAAKHNQQEVLTIFDKAQRGYIKVLLLELFDLSDLWQNQMSLSGILHLHKNRLSQSGLTWAKTFGERIELLNDVAQKFGRQLEYLIDNARNLHSDDDLQTRIKQASSYFESELKKCLDFLKECSLLTESKEAATELNENLQSTFETLYTKITLLQTCLDGFVFNNFIQTKLRLKFPDYRINTYATSSNVKVSSDVAHPALYRQLMLKRDEILNEENKPVYLVANSKTLTEMTNYLPDTPDRLLKISGFGEAKVEAYGDDFLKIIKAYMSEHNLETNIHALGVKKTKKSKKEKSQKQGSTAVSDKKPNTKEQTFQLFKQGVSIEEIAAQRGFTLTTIQTHLVPYIASGEIMIDELVPTNKQKMIAKALEKFNYEDGLTVVKSKLPADITYAEIRYVMAHRLKD